eukprot:gene9655-biopygen2514
MQPGLHIRGSGEILMGETERPNPPDSGGSASFPEPVTVHREQGAADGPDGARHRGEVAVARESECSSNETTSCYTSSFPEFQAPPHESGRFPGSCQLLQDLYPGQRFQLDMDWPQPPPPPPQAGPVPAVPPAGAAGPAAAAGNAGAAPLLVAGAFGPRKGVAEDRSRVRGDGADAARRGHQEKREADRHRAARLRGAQHPRLARAAAAPPPLRPAAAPFLVFFLRLLLLLGSVGIPIAELNP